MDYTAYKFNQSIRPASMEGSPSWNGRVTWQVAFTCGRKLYMCTHCLYRTIPWGLSLKKYIVSVLYISLKKIASYFGIRFYLIFFSSLFRQPIEIILAGTDDDVGEHPDLTGRDPVPYRGANCCPYCYDDEVRRRVFLFLLFLPSSGPLRLRQLGPI
jgi:hypothetical protein